MNNIECDKFEDKLLSKMNIFIFIISLWFVKAKKCIYIYVGEKEMLISRGVLEVTQPLGTTHSIPYDILGDANTARVLDHSIRPRCWQAWSFSNVLIYTPIYIYHKSTCPMQRHPQYNEQRCMQSLRPPEDDRIYIYIYIDILKTGSAFTHTHILYICKYD